MSSEIEFPVGEHQEECAICGGELELVAGGMTKSYPNLVCWECDQRAVNEWGEEPKTGAVYREQVKAESENPEEVSVSSDSGENPVFIDGKKCWRRYRFGGHVTQVDEFDCENLIEFNKNHYTGDAWTELSDVSET